MKFWLGSVVAYVALLCVAPIEADVLSVSKLNQVGFLKDEIFLLPDGSEVIGKVVSMVDYASLVYYEGLCTINCLTFFNFWGGIFGYKIAKILYE